MRLISSFVDSCLRLSREENATLMQAVTTDNVLTLEEQEVALELTTSWKEEGLQEGFAMGMQQGIRQGEEQLVLRLLTRRVGTLPVELEAQIRNLPLDGLDTLSGVLLDFTDQNDFITWPGAHQV